MPKATLNDEVKQPAMATRRPWVSVPAGWGCCQPAQESSGSCLRGPTLPSEETCRTGKFQFGLEFCCVFLGRRQPPSIPGLMAKVTPTGGPTQAWEALVLWIHDPCWLTASPHLVGCVGFLHWKPNCPFHEMNSILNSGCALLSSMELVLGKPWRSWEETASTVMNPRAGSQTDFFNPHNPDMVCFLSFLQLLLKIMGNGWEEILRTQT